MATFYKCDRCHKVFDKACCLANITLPKTEYNYQLNKTLPSTHDSSDDELCAECIEELHNVLKTIPKDREK